MTPTGGDGEIVEIGADENDAGRGRRGQDADVDLDSVVKPYAARLDRPLQSRFELQTIHSISVDEGSPRLLI